MNAMRHTIFSLALISLAGTASAQSITWDLANEYPPNSIHAQASDTFIAKLAELSSGDIKIVAHHGAALGYKSLDQFDAVGGGAVDVASSLSTPWSGIHPIFTLSSMPFLVKSVDENFKLYQIAKPYYEKVLADDNQVLLFATPWPPSGLWGNKALDSMEAIKGVRIRTYDVNGTTTLANAGATPIQLTWADTVPQLTTNGLDGVLTSADGGVSALLWEHQSHFTEVNYAMPLQFVHINLDTYEDLSDAQKAQVREAAAAAEKFGWDALATRVSENYAQMEANKMTIVKDVAPEYLDALAGAAAPALADWKSKLGADADEILKAFEAAR